MPKQHFKKLEFYITNVCNLTCSNCNRFNDHDFKGWQRWSDYEEDYRRWAELITVEDIVILGGEPLLNPTICEWVTGLSECFERKVQVLTNGTRLNRTPGLYESLLTKADTHWPSWIGISVHNEYDLPRYFEEAQKFLRGDIRTYHGRDTRDEQNFYVSYGADYTFVDSNRVQVRMWIQDSFYNAAIHRGAPREVDGAMVPGALTVYNNDPEESHRDCGFVLWKNYHMIRGKLYKCGPAVLMAEFDQQHRLDITEQDRTIMHAYQPLSAWDDADTQQRFFDNIDRVIPQCKFCPTKNQIQNQKIWATLKTKNATGTFG